ncbi:MAG: hypothetical protein JXA54_12400 [Candidatus Heimdallarchaeota archaeon]|nr:hypothetical protein [Candidatus Heimdallarchaeota archaeon]
MKYKKEFLALLIMSTFIAVTIPTVAVMMAGAQEAKNTFAITPIDFVMDTRATYSYTFLNPVPGETVSGTETIQIRATYGTATLYRVRIAVYRNGAILTSYYDLTHIGSNVWQINWNTANYADGTGYSLRFVLYRSSYYYTSVYCNNLVINNGGGGTTPPPSGGEKIAVFFWASDAGTATVINKYITYLQREGYTKFFNFKDSTNVASACQSVDDYETSEDTIFVYIIGHGNNDGSHSYTCFRPSASVVYSNTFRGYMNNWEAGRKAIFVESCHSGDWADDFRASPYLAMSTSDETHVSYAYSTLPGEGKMSYYFFQRVYAGYNAVDSYNYARQYCTNQYPKIADYSTYVWFV